MGNGLAPIVSLAGLFMGAAIGIACVGDSEVEVPFATAPAEAGAPDGGEPATCPPPDLTPGGCQTNQDSCAPPGGGTPRCIGKNDTCASTAVMRCLGSSSCAGRPCCYNGPIVTGKACAKTGLQNDTECTPAPAPGASACNGAKDHVTCLNDLDCQPFAAGKCVTMLIGTTKRSIGICDGT